MKTLLTLLLSITILSLISCAPKVRTSLAQTANYSALPFNEEVYVFEKEDSLPPIIQELGEIKISDSGFTTQCSYEQVLERAKIEARKAGGNTLVITEHKLPGFASSCHRIVARLLKTEIDSAFIKNRNASTIEGADYALLYVYRYGGTGALISYDLHLGDSTICRVKTNSADTIRITQEGKTTLWASTEAREELPIEIKKRNEYYIRCGLSLGVLVGRPSIEQVGREYGKQEFDAIILKKKKK